MNYQPIENYAIIGDLNTIALIGINGSIDFLCFPFYDSPSIFAALLDYQKGGYFKIHPIIQEEVKNKQMYLPGTNVLLTRFLSADGVGEITDYMPMEGIVNGNELVRRVSCIRGNIRFKMECRPRFNYGRDTHTARKKNQSFEILFESQGESPLKLRLKSSVPLQISDNDGYAEFTLNEGERADFILEDISKEDPPNISLGDFITKTFFETVKYWRDWISKSTYKGRWLEAIQRSSLTLKLLCSARFGSIVASPTFGLPEFIGGNRNWDYRYSWIRDSAFCLYALIKTGYTKESQAFVKWIHHECRDIGNPGHLHLIYSIAGDSNPLETILHNFEGYKRSAPVRIGNNASQQLQLDIYGELLDSVYLYNKYVEPISHDFWNNLVFQINWLTDNWKREDNGIWEVRGRVKHFLFSRLMCWVAFDRAIKIAESRSFPYPETWKTERNKIYQSIYSEFWDDDLKGFVQYQGAKTVDASCLFMPIVKFISPIDPRWLQTMEAIERELVSDSLVYRYIPEIAAPDGLGGREGTFSMCTFWYVECLSRSGQLQKAQFYFEKMLGYANHVGIFSEQLGFMGEHLGNFPQAFSHAGLISAALNLNAQLDKVGKTDTDPEFFL
jgi:GH15 family glucan-1,4-alpha-glucosidase